MQKFAREVAVEVHLYGTGERPRQAVGPQGNVSRRLADLTTRDLGAHGDLGGSACESTTPIHGRESGRRQSCGSCIPLSIGYGAAHLLPVRVATERSGAVGGTFGTIQIECRQGSNNSRLSTDQRADVELSRQLS